ncbi:hypothetical protein U1Q18_029521, partial [Sarracenia purpurea var. burkii]
NSRSENFEKNLEELWGLSCANQNMLLLGGWLALARCCCFGPSFAYSLLSLVVFHFPCWPRLLCVLVSTLVYNFAAEFQRPTSRY